MTLYIQAESWFAHDFEKFENKKKKKKKELIGGDLKMKFLTTNFIRCAVKSCDGQENSFPLSYQEITLVQKEQKFNPLFIANMLDRIDWPAILKVASDLGNSSLPPNKPDNIDVEDPDNEQLLKDLHTLLMETELTDGKMICGNCSHIYYIKNSIANFLLPPHLAN